MKKSLLTLLFALPFFGFGQLFTFTTGTEGWVLRSGPANVSANFGYLEVVPSTTATGNYIDINNPSYTIDSNVYKAVRIKAKNTTVSTSLKVRPDNTSSTAALNTITTGDTGYTDYYFDMTSTTNLSTLWTGTITKLDIRLTKNASPEAWSNTTVLSIDEIEFLQNLYKGDYQFNALEYWSATGGSAVLSSGKVVLTPTGGTGVVAKIIQGTFWGDSANKYVHVIYKNNSPTNNTLRLNFKSPADSYTAFVAVDKTIPTSMPSFDEAIFDLSANGSWTGAIKNLQFVLFNSALTTVDNTVVPPVTTNTAEANGTLEIDRIVINNSSATLSASEISKSKNMIQAVVSNNELIFRNATVAKAVIYNTAGQLVKDVPVKNNSMDVSSLKAGIYIVKATEQDKTETITKFIKN